MTSATPIGGSSDVSNPGSASAVRNTWSMGTTFWFGFQAESIRSAAADGYRRPDHPPATGDGRP